MIEPYLKVLARDIKQIYPTITSSITKETSSNTITEIITNNKISKLEEYIKKSRRIDNDYYPTESEPNP